jgi:hypothetical protein
MPRGPISTKPDVEPTLPVRTAIQLVLNGETEVHVVGAPVTYLLSNVDGFDQGFLFQADHTGPALIVVAPTDGIVAGDRVSLVVTGTVMGLNGYPTVTQFDDLSVTGRAELFDIIQDLSTNEAIVNSGHTFHDEYITVMKPAHLRVLQTSAPNSRSNSGLASVSAWVTT